MPYRSRGQRNRCPSLFRCLVSDSVSHHIGLKSADIFILEHIRERLLRLTLSIAADEFFYFNFVYFHIFSTAFEIINFTVGQLSPFSLGKIA
jgi:hypothetical protein